MWTLSSFFGAHLPEWLNGDQAVSCLLSAEQLDALESLVSEPTLKLGKEVANTEKHHTRTWGNTVFVDQVAIFEGDQRTEARIKVVGSDVPEDALDLANRFILAWEEFFERNSLKTTGI